MSSLGGPETESAAAKWLRKPLVIGLAIIDTVAGSFRIAGASAQFMRRSLREAAERQYEPIFASKSRFCVNPSRGENFEVGDIWRLKQVSRLQPLG